MIVEFIGSTGAGKTTLFRHVQQKLAKNADVVTPFELLAERFGLPRVANVSAQHLVQELLGFPYFLWSLKHHREFVSFILRTLAGQGKFTVFTVNNLRSLVRKLGAYEMAGRTKPERIILVDEGTVLTAHNVFVFSNVAYAGESIARFAGLVPLPDMIVYIKAPVDILLQRSLQRPDPPREIRAKDAAFVREYIVRARSLFDQLTELDNIRSRMVIVEHADIAGQGIDAVADRIADSILNRKTSSQPIHAAQQFAPNS